MGPDLGPGCGDGVVTAPEVCDVGIPSDYAGGCPDDCDDQDRCTTDTVVGVGCEASCQHAPLTICASGDGCCTPGCTAATDAECIGACSATTCANGDDCCPTGCTTGNDDDCAEPAAFRMYSMRLLDPHALTPGFIQLVGCTDITNNALAGISAVNESLQRSLDDLVLNPIMIFDPLIRDSGTPHPMRVVFGACTSTTQCSTGTSPPLDVNTSYTNGNGATPCLGPYVGTTSSSYAPPVASIFDECFASASVANAVVPIQLDSGPLDLPLERVQLAGIYDADPATGLVQGLLRGFVSESAAATALLPEALPFIGGDPMAEVFLGGVNNGCPGDDRDRLVPSQPESPTNPSGWWFYVAFIAQRITFE